MPVSLAGKPHAYHNGAHNSDKKDPVTGTGIAVGFHVGLL